VAAHRPIIFSPANFFADNSPAIYGWAVVGNNKNGPLERPA